MSEIAKQGQYVCVCVSLSLGQDSDGEEIQKGEKAIASVLLLLLLPGAIG